VNTSLSAPSQYTGTGVWAEKRVSLRTSGTDTSVCHDEEFVVRHQVTSASILSMP